MATVMKELDIRQHKNPEWERAVDEMAKIERRIFPKHESLSNSFQTELKKTNTGLIYITSTVENNDDIIGYVMYSWASSLSASITKLAVKEKFRRQGHGEALLKAAINKCTTRNIQRISLHVDPSRTAAVSLYKKLGFEIDAVIERYYSSERDAYRMYLEFAEKW